MTDSNLSATSSKHQTRISATMQMGANLLRRQLWIWPILAAVVFGAVGLAVHSAVEDAMGEQRKSALDTILKTEIEAINTWTREQCVNAELLARDEALAPLIRELAALVNGKDSAAALQQASAQAALRDRLKEPVKICGYHGFYVFAPDNTVLACDENRPVGMKLTEYREAFNKKLMSGKPAVSKPYLSVMPLKDEKGIERANIPTMLVAAPIVASGEPIAALALRIRPDDHFTRILRVASPGGSGETYAFDKNGVLLSQSRNDDLLKRIGLLPDRPDSQSILQLELRDPGVNMVTGGRPRVRRSEQPLTLLAKEATAGNEGFNVDGYNDYRGVPVVGAWKWLPDLDLGIATEIEAAEAFRPVYVLRRSFWALMGLLLLSAIGIFIAMEFIRRQQHALRKATLEAKQLGQYTLELKIGAGGMGTVYRAQHALLRRATAVKLLDIDKISDAAIARFQREVQLTSQLNHPNTIAIYDYGKTPEGIFYYAMEFLDGVTLEQLVARHGPLPEGRVIKILEQICGSLAEAHEVGLIHRDIKPANIILNHRGGVADLVKVLDFGLVKSVGAEQDLNITAANALTGTPLYLAPESVEHPDTVDMRADLYAIGAVGYFLLTGTPVFSGKSVMEICMHHMRTQPDSPSSRLGRDVSKRLEDAILQCLAKDRTARPASARHLQEMLANCETMHAWTRDDAEEWWLRFRQATIVSRPVPTEISKGSETVALPQAPP